MKDHAAAVVSDEAFAQRAERWPVDTPDTKEAYFIREMFQGTCARVAVQAFRGLLAPQLTSRPKPRPRQPYGESHQGLACSRVMGADGGLFFFFSSWIPRGDWGCASDPSGRSVKIHNAAYEATE